MSRNVVYLTRDGNEILNKIFRNRVIKSDKRCALNGIVEEALKLLWEKEEFFDKQEQAIKEGRVEFE